MNLVTDIMDQFSGDLTGQLGLLLKTDEDSVSFATSAAVPALLAGLSSVASSGDGINKLTAALNGLGSSTMDQIANMLHGDAEAVANRGNILLSSLFGDNMIERLASLLERSSGLSGNVIRKLLALLAPMVLGKIASAWKSKGGTPQALTNLFSEQRHNIAEAVPAGISLADVPGWSTIKEGASAVADAGRRTASTAGAGASSAAGWVVPLLLGALALFVIWSFMRNRPDETAKVEPNEPATQEVTAQKPIVPAESAAVDVPRINADLRTVIASAGDAFRDIKDATSAEAARPQLEELIMKIDNIKTMLVSLPEADIASVRTTADEQLASLKEQAEKTLETPGLSAELKSLINMILQKISELFAPAGP